MCSAERTGNLRPSHRRVHGHHTTRASMVLSMSLLWTQLVWPQSSADWETEDGLACGGESGPGWSDVGQVKPWDRPMDRLWGASGRLEGGREQFPWEH